LVDSVTRAEQEKADQFGGLPAGSMILFLTDGTRGKKFQKFHFFVYARLDTLQKEDGSIRTGLGHHSTLLVTPDLIVTTVSGK
jgi:hypothetical protein